MGRLPLGYRVVEATFVCMLEVAEKERERETTERITMNEEGKENLKT